MFSLRIDRTFSVGAMYPFFRLMGTCDGIPILMYHGIRGAQGSKHPYYETSTSPEMFAAHMQLLSDHGYQAISLRDLNSGFERQKKQVVITFDDAYLDFYTKALPILDRHNFKATIFVVCEFAGHGNASTNEKYLTWDQIREINRCGMEIGSHTYSHPELHSISQKLLVHEVAESKIILEGEIGEQIQSFAYPYAFPRHRKTFIALLQRLLQESGYIRGVCTSVGIAKKTDNRFFLPRIPMNTYDDLRFFSAKLIGSYNWFGTAQSIRKYLSR